MKLHFIRMEVLDLTRDCYFCAYSYIKYFCMTIKNFGICFFLFYFFACEQNPGPPINKTRFSIKDQLIQVDTKLKQQQDVQKDKALAKEFIQLAKAFAKQEPQDTLVPLYIFRGAEVARALGNYGEAIKLLDKACTEYRKFDKRPDALFLQGFTYDQDLNNKKAAQKYYQEFLEQFPKHPFAKDVQLLMQYIQQDKSAEELVKEFEKK